MGDIFEALQRAGMPPNDPRPPLAGKVGHDDDGDDGARNSSAHNTPRRATESGAGAVPEMSIGLDSQAGAAQSPPNFDQLEPFDATPASGSRSAAYNASNSATGTSAPPAGGGLHADAAPSPHAIRNEPAGRIRAHQDDYDDRLVVATEPAKAAAEQYRAIRTGMLARWRQQRHLIHTITSATPQEGKTITSLNLGLSLAELRNRRTLVVEADLRIPQFANLLHLDDGPGLAEILDGQASYKDTIQSTAGGMLHVIPAGRKVNTRAIQLLSGNATASLFKELRRDYDHIIVDTPPVVELADAGILGSLSDDVLLIVRMNRTPRTLIDQAVRTLESYNAPVAGMIATDHPRHRERYYNYRYGYRYRYRYYSQAA